MAHGIKTEHGETEDGKNLYTKEEHERLGEHSEQLSDAQFEDWNRAKSDGRVRGRESESSEPEDSEPSDLSDLSPDEKAKRLGRRNRW